MHSLRENYEVTTHWMSSSLSPTETQSGTFPNNKSQSYFRSFVLPASSNKTYYI